MTWADYIYFVSPFSNTLLGLRKIQIHIGWLWRHFTAHLSLPLQWSLPTSMYTDPFLSGLLPGPKQSHVIWIFPPTLSSPLPLPHASPQIYFSLTLRTLLWVLGHPLPLVKVVSGKSLAFVHASGCLEVKVKVSVAQLCPTLWDPRTVAHQVPHHGILQASIIKWVAIPFSNRCLEDDWKKTCSGCSE